MGEAQSSTNGVEQTRYPRRMNLYPYLAPYTQLNSEWLKHLNVRLKTIILMEENTEKKSSEYWPWQRFLGYDTMNAGNKNKNRQV